MTETELWDALDGLMAYDTGCLDSGIHDEHLRQRVIDHLQNLPENEHRLTLSRFIREHFLTEEALAQQYGIEDVAKFIQWIDDEMGINI